MVQRKLANSLGIQADHHVKSEKKLLGNLKPNSYHHHQHHDGKNRGPDIKKKKIKRYRSIKVSDMDALKSSPGKQLPRAPTTPQKQLPKAPTTPQKQQPILSTARKILTHLTSPNYMKSTTSSEARKEHTQVSRYSSYSKRFSASSDKPTRSLLKTCSSKLVRTLTRTPSFKPARGTNKTSSRVPLWVEGNVRKATCSSTLKDSKFPNYLLLDPGGTEAEGTSAMKVCPYTYCSLNGHHHAPLPPLKSFLKVRRRSLKTQKGMKLAVLSPRRANPFKAENDDLDAGLLRPSAGKSEYKEVDLVLQEERTDFFIEIYAKMSENNDEPGKSIDLDNQRSCNGENEGPADEQNKSVDKDDASDMSGRKATLEDNSSEPAILEGQLLASSERDDEISEAIDMEWEEGQFSTLQIDQDVHDQYSVAINHSSGKLDLDDENEIVISDDNVSECTVEILSDNILKELFEEEDGSFDIQHNDGNSEMDGQLGGQEKSECSNITVDSFPDDTSQEITNKNEKGRDDETDQTKSESQKPNDAESTQHSDDNSPSLKEFIWNNVAADVVEDKKQETNEEWLSWNTISDLPHICGQNDHSNDAVTSNEIHEKADEIVEDRVPADVENFKSVGQKRKKPTFLDEHSDSVAYKANFIGDSSSDEAVENPEAKAPTKAVAIEKPVEDNDGSNKAERRTGLWTGSNTKDEVSNTSDSIKWSRRCKKPIKDLEEQRKFNPKEPNFLPIVPDPEAEKVDLKHQTMDNRRNSEEWMLDYALRQAVTKLAPARKRKVALLVEAFETVLPEPKHEARLRNMPTIFSATSTIQACS